jgi:hypothetical protein
MTMHAFVLSPFCCQSLGQTGGAGLLQRTQIIYDLCFQLGVNLMRFQGHGAMSVLFTEEQVFAVNLQELKPKAGFYTE